MYCSFVFTLNRFYSLLFSWNGIYGRRDPFEIGIVLTYVYLEEIFLLRKGFFALSDD
jgi:hypothetical protein